VEDNNGEDSSGFGWDADLNCVVAEDWVWDRYIEVGTIQAGEAGGATKIHSMGSHDWIESPSLGYVKGIPSDISQA